jgi:uncharacterized protein (DUF2336 family)
MTSLDAESLLKLARDKSQAGRTALAETVSDLFVDKGTTLTDRERALMFDILRRMIHDFEMSVRKVISQHMASWNDIPAELATTLANDEIEVAYPMLVNSGVLQDTSLIEVIQHRTLEHQMAIAIRHTVSEIVSDALVEAGDTNVIATLLGNPNASISESTMAFLVEESQRVDTFQEPILRRDDLDPNLAKRMLMWVSAALRKYVLENFDIDKATVDEILEISAVQVTSSGGEAKVYGMNPANQLAENLHIEGEATPEFMIAALKDGQVHLFVSLLQQLTGLRSNLLMRILFEPGGEGLAIICKGIDFDDEAFSTIYSLTRKARAKGKGRDKKEFESAMKLYSTITVETANEVIQLWKRNVDYLSAIRELERSL